jgi:HPt (histidine-containing phosphotransfer) domain-containing protein
MLLNAIEAGLPDSQFAPGTLSSLAWLVESDGSLDDAELAQCLRRAARLTGAVTARARSRFQILIRYCRALMEREPDAAPGMAELRCAYLENRRAQFENLERSLENGDFRIISEAAHNMKGTGAAYGFAEITEIARAMESAAKRQDTDAVGHLLARLDCYVGGVTKPALAA